jgi:hypothetical protein
MLTSAQREKCRAIAQALDAGDLQPWRRAEASLSPAEKGLVWDLRQRQAQARQVSPQSAGKPPRPPRVETELRLDDLDHWASDDDQDDGDDDDDGEVLPCGACNGRGKDAAGNRCSVCNGSGKVTPSDGDENEDETDDDEDQDE